MNKKNFLWFSQTGSSSSFSRITETVVPLILNNCSLTLLSSIDTIGPELINRQNRYKFVKIGSDTKSITMNNFFHGVSKENQSLEKKITYLEASMKYILIQISELLYEGSYDYIVLLNGIYETKWFAEQINLFQKIVLKKTKVIVWSPIDYVPSKELMNTFISNSIKFITMTPIMADKIKELCLEISVDWVGHGYEIVNNPNAHTMTREKAIKELNKMEFLGPMMQIDPDAIYILNANNCKATRKRFDITIGAFNKLCSNESFRNKKIFLWLHTDLKSLYETFGREFDNATTMEEKIIFTDNTKTTSYQLMLIYKACSIGLQTSEGEGWSLTNTEHSMYSGAIQVVPDFLATGYHFGNNRGILIPVKEHEQASETNKDDKVIVGTVSVQDTCIALLKAIKMLGTKEASDMVKAANEHIKQFTWHNVAENFLNIVTQA